MYIIVVGGGEVGYYLSRILVSQGHEVLVLERGQRRSDFISEELGDIVVSGDGCEARTLGEIGTGRADMFIAVTGDDEDNMVSCQVAKHRFKVPHTIARIKNPRNSILFEKLGIDATVSSTDLILTHIEQELPSRPVVPLLKIKGTGSELVQSTVEPGAKIRGKKIKDIRLPGNAFIVLVISKTAGPQMPTNDTVIQEGDDIIAVSGPENGESIKSLLTKQ
ncbi:MAG: potassium channel family protein [Dehalococcoidia bacterium]